MTTPDEATSLVERMWEEQGAFIDSAPRTIAFDGPCPFLLCLETGPHTHPVCPDCGAVRYGNLSCTTCRERRASEGGR